MRRNSAFNVVKDFEFALQEFTGAPHAVTVDSCTNAIFLAMKRCNLPTSRVIEIPRWTYVGVPQAIKNAGYTVRYRTVKWQDSYKIEPTNIWDAAKYFCRGMYEPATTMCISFQAGKILPIGRGGAILTDNQADADWYRKARLDGRTAGADYKDNTYAQQGWHCYLTPPDAARGLWLMTYLEDDDQANWTEYPDLSEATWI